MDEIIPGLWIGDWNDAQDGVVLINRGINNVLCVIPHVHAPPENRTWYDLIKLLHWHYEYYKDIDTETPLDFIENALSHGNAVLVHCGQGVDRSPTVVMLFLVRRRHFSVEQAVNLIKQKRPIAKPHPEQVGLTQ